MPAQSAEQRRTAAVARLLTHLLAPAARRRGFTEIAVVERWADIVGPVLARRCQPVRLEFARGRTAGATLVLHAAGGAAIELQHQQVQLVERINGYFGFPAVRSPLRIVQMPLRARPAPVEKRPRDLSEAEKAELETTVAGVESAELRDALAALGRSIKARRASG